MNAFINLIKLAWLQLVRHRVRSLLTIAGVASGMFLFTAVETLQRSLAKATEAGAADTTLVLPDAQDALIAAVAPSSSVARSGDTITNSKESAVVRRFVALRSATIRAGERRPGRADRVSLRAES